ncbi:MAG: RIP metalloprotease RseP, partial [Pseudomonadota bacterium]
MTSIFDLFQLIASNVWLYGGTFLLVLSILVFVHEWGHYIVARMCGVRVEVFSIGFGKEIFGKDDKHGTRWKFSLIPLGGYVKMFGDTDPASAGHSDNVEDGEQPPRPMTDKERGVAFFAKPVWQRSLIVFAGPAINFLFAILILAGLYTFYGQPITPPLASAVIVDSAADRAGFEPHDRVLTIDGVKINRFEDIRRVVTVALDTPLKFMVERNGEIVEFTATPDKEELEDRFGFKQSRGLLGIIGPGNGLMLESILSVDGKSVEGADQVRDALWPKLGQDMTVQLDRGAEVDVIRVKPLKDLNEGFNDPEHVDYEHLVVTNTLDESFIKHSLPSALLYAVNETWVITASTFTALGQMITGVRSATELGGIIRIGAIAGDMAQAGLIALITFTALLSINL